MTKLSLLHPSRGRPKQFAEVNKLWQHKDVDYLAGVDEQDKEDYIAAGCDDFITMKGPRLELRDLNLTGLPSSTKGYLTSINKLNRLARLSIGDWIGMVADDLYPSPDFLDKLLEYLSNFDPKEKLVFSFDNSRQLIQHGIISRSVYDELGFYDHPDFFHVYSDNYSYQLCTRRGWLRELPKDLAAMVVHKHPAFNSAANDTTYTIGNHPLLYEQGKATLERLLHELDNPPQPKIGVSVCVHNNENTIAQVLKSISSFADIIHITDNDSTDTTLDIIRAQYPTAVVSKFPGRLWDFSALKNVGIKYLDDKVDWIFCIDSDDVVTNGDIVRNATNTDSDCLVGSIVFDNGLSYPQARMFKTGRGIKYIYPVHELLSGYTKAGHIPLIVKPIGQPKKHDQEPALDRNLRILAAVVNPGARELFYLGNTLRELKRYSEAIKAYTKYLDISDCHDERMLAYLYTARCYRADRHYQLCIDTCFEALSQDTKFSELLVELSYAYSDIGHWHQSLTFARLAKKPFPDTQLFIEKDKYTTQPDLMIASVLNDLEKLK